MARAQPLPHCFGGPWDPNAEACARCRVQSPCVETIVGLVQSAGGGDAPTIALRHHMTPAAAEVIAHAVARIASPVAAAPAALEPVSPMFARWAQEREARPEIARLQPGDQITRVFDGQTHVVTCGFGFWEYAGQRFPTLASTVVAIAGARDYPRQRRSSGSRPDGTRKGAICSAVRFFKLKQKREDS